MATLTDMSGKVERFVSSRLEFLVSHLAGYEKAIKQGNGTAYLDNVIAGYFRRYPEEKFPFSEEPPAEWLAQVNDNILIKDREQPQRYPSESQSDFEERCRKFNAIKKRHANRLQAVRASMRRKVKNTIEFYEKHDETWHIVMSRLAGIPIGKVGRLRTGYNVWAAHNGELVDRLLAERKREVEENTISKDPKNGPECGAAPSNTDNNDNAANSSATTKTVKKPAPVVKIIKGDNAEKRSEGLDRGSGEISGDGKKKGQKKEKKAKFPVAWRQEIIKAEFEKLSEEEQQRWADLAKREYGEKREQWQALQAAGYSEAPGDRQG
ncbi:hypothetical protein V5O48_019226, partial [Marasmius crinis-equi]